MADNYALQKLKRAKQRGCTIYDFRVGYRLADAVFKLREKGHLIDTTMIDDNNADRRIARYIYKGKK